MAKKTSSKEYDLKAARDLYLEYLEKGKEKKDIILPSGTVKIDNLNRKEIIDRLYGLVDGVLVKIYNNGRPSVELPSRSGTNIIWDEENDLL